MTWSWPIPTERPLVAPSLLAADFAHLATEILAVETGGADLLHVDVMDGQFVPNITIGPVVIESIRRFTSLFLDTHLMIVEPERFAREFRKAGCDGITVHAEASPDLGSTLAAVRETGARCGLALNPDTPLEPYLPHLGEVDLLLLMTVFPGRGGQSFMPGVLPKIAQAAELRAARGWRFAIEVDGGIAPATAALVRARGADILVAGSAIFRSPPYTEAIVALRAAAAPFTP